MRNAEVRDLIPSFLGNGAACSLIFSMAISTQVNATGKKWNLPATVRRAYAIISAAKLPVALSTSFDIIAAVRMRLGAFVALRRCK